MKKALKKQNNELYFYEGDTKKIVKWDDKTTYPKNIEGNITELRGYISSKLRGDISGLRGYISGLWGDISSEFRGNISSELWGNISGLRGDISGISGNLADCEITEEERKKGINIEDLIKTSEIIK